MPRSFQNTCVIETGPSDFCLMTLKFMRKSFKKLKPRVINYRSYKQFLKFLIKRITSADVNKDNRFQVFQYNNYALRKAKHTRGNQMLFMAKDISKYIMKRLRLSNKYLKNNSEENRKLYTKQRNYCVSLLRKTKKAL